jgi:hypothetical protein
MKYPLEELLNVRRHREETAQVEVTRRRRHLESAEETVRRKEKELEEYIAWRTEREEQLYREIIDQQIQIRALDDLKLKISLLREKQVIYEDHVTEAKRNLQEAEATLTEAQDQYRTSVKESEKIDEHKELWAQEERKRCEAEAEKEMEDFRVRRAEFEESVDQA